MTEITKQNQLKIAKLVLSSAFQEYQKIDKKESENYLKDLEEQLNS